MADIIPIHPIPGHLFSWNKGKGITEESTLVANGYEDFVSEFTIKSHRTGAYMTFYYEDEILTGEIFSDSPNKNELYGWRYASQEGVDVTILND